MANEKILIVEDEAVVALNLQNLLRRLDYKVVARVDNGTAAIDTVSNTHLDLILMDIRLKGELDGIETAQLIYKISNIPIIFLTAYNDDSTVKRAMGSRSFGYLIKPFDERQLHIAIQLELHKKVVDHKLLVQSNQQRQIIDSISQGIALIDNNGNIKHGNQIFLQYVEILRKHLNLVDHETNQINNKLLDEWSQQTGSGDWYEVIVDEPNYRVFELQICALTTSNYIDSDVDTEDCILIIRDQTKQRIAIQRDLQQEKLATIGQLAAGISHDFNNILASLRIQADLMSLQTTDLSTYQADRVQNIKRDIDRAKDLVNQILDFSRVSTSEAGSIHLNDVINDVIELLYRTMPESLQLSSQVTSDTIVIKGDRTQLIQIIMNLALNARDAMLHGGTFAVSLTQTADTYINGQTLEGNWACIKIEDTGIGMSEEILHRMFEPFFTTKFASGGTGLGLSQVYGLVQQHSGFVDYSSRVGVGTVFRVFLPIISNTIEYDIDPTTNQAELLPLAKSKCILIVEDDNFARESLSDLLQMAEYHVVCAVDGVNALEILDTRRNEIDVVLSDVMMPKMTGLQLYHEVVKSHGNLPFGFMTGYAPESEIGEIIASSNSEVLKKPFSAEDLFAFIDDLIR